MPREEKKQNIRVRQPQIIEEVGRTDRRKNRDMEQEPAEVEKGKKARI
jgi:hypothetical protein